MISLERYTLSVYRAGEIDLFENLDIVHIRLLVVVYEVLQVRSLRVLKEVVKALSKEMEVLEALQALSPPCRGTTPYTLHPSPYTLHPTTHTQTRHRP